MSFLDNKPSSDQYDFQSMKGTTRQGCPLRKSRFPARWTWCKRCDNTLKRPMRYSRHSL